MLLETFQTDALRDMCTEEQLDLLNSIDSLRSQGISHYISLPQIIVCGDQSSGKSSVLEAISGVAFPVKSNLCTRFPTELVLRKHAHIGVRVSIVPHHTRSDVEQRSLGDFCEELNSFEGLPVLIERAKEAMGITTHGKAFSNDLLRVEVSGPDRPHLTIVDLPGLIHSETRKQSAMDVQLVQDVVQSYMKQPRSIILAVVSAKNDFANQIVLKLARDADPSGKRTLGIITKPDTLIAGSESETMFVSLAKNQDVEFRLGWHVLKNMDMDQGQSTLAQRDLEEEDFFSHGIWKDLPSSLVGIGSLRTRLSKVLLSQIATELPSLIIEIEDKIGHCKSRLRRLGQPRITIDQQKSYLLQISQSLQELVKSAVDGTYNDPFFGDAQSTKGYHKRIRAIVQNHNEEFAQRVHRRGHYRRICEPNDGQIPAKHQIGVTREQYIKHISHLLRRTRGRELPGTFNPLIVRDLFLEQCSPWEQLTRSHTKSVWAAARDFLAFVVRHVTDDATSAAVIEEIILPACDTIKRDIDAKTEELLIPHQTRHPITYNHYLTENLQKVRAERDEAELAKNLKSFFRVDSLEEPYCTDHSINLEQLLKSLIAQSEPDMVRFASIEALDCMLAYYKVALKRFVDDIANEVVEARLMSSLSRILSPVTVFDMPANLIARIAGESKESQSIREQLSRELLILTKGSETCRQFVKTKTGDLDFDTLLADDYLERDSSDESICEEARLAAEESELSDSSNDLVGTTESLDDLMDEITTPHFEEGPKPSIQASKNASKKKKSKGKKKVEDIASLELL
ncbi:dynamin family protein [Penicillium frequentans]|uniref:Dynamin family protein n=1 Tax=Penicillium frequentans TaxID=3151616 RepID=A0AAD6D6L7_9EURO|nr:dynamin family protein [Penicillium glabrum]